MNDNRAVLRYGGEQVDVEVLVVIPDDTIRLRPDRPGSDFTPEVGARGTLVAEDGELEVEVLEIAVAVDGAAGEFVVRPLR